MPTGYDIWGAIAGVLGIVGLLPPLYTFVKGQLPSSKLKILHDTMAETESLFRTVTEEGLLKNSSYVAQTERRLTQLRSEVEDLRATTHRATSFFQEMKEAASGLSRQISLLCKRVEKVRASISATSSEERKRLLDGNPHDITPLSSITSVTTTVIGDSDAAVARSDRGDLTGNGLNANHTVSADGQREDCSPVFALSSRSSYPLTRASSCEMSCAYPTLSADESPSLVARHTQGLLRRLSETTLDRVSIALTTASPTMLAGAEKRPGTQESPSIPSSSRRQKPLSRSSNQIPTKVPRSRGPSLTLHPRTLPSLSSRILLHNSKSCIRLSRTRFSSRHALAKVFRRYCLMVDNRAITLTRAIRQRPNSMLCFNHVVSSSVVSADDDDEWEDVNSVSSS